MFDKAMSHLTLQDVIDFCAQKIPENSVLDYKKDVSGTKPNFQIAKVISAMANANGGWTFFGVEEAGIDQMGRGLPGEVVGIDATKRLAETIKKVCLSSIRPPIVPELHCIQVDNIQNTEIVLVRVHESDSTPHALTDNGRVYIRVDDISHLANDGKEASVDQIELLLNRRAKSVALRDSLLERAETRYNIDIDQAQMIFSCIPTFPQSPLCSYERLADAANRARGTSIFGDNEKLMTAFESVWAESAFDQPAKQLYEFGVHGLCFVKRQLPVKMSDLTNHRRVEITDPCGNLYAFLSTSRIFLEQIGFTGLVDLSIGMRDDKRRTVFGFPNNHSTWPGPDKRFDVKRRALVGDLSHDSFALDLIREFMWCTGIGPDIQSSDLPQVILGQLKPPSR